MSMRDRENMHTINRSNTSRPTPTHATNLSPGNSPSEVSKLEAIFRMRLYVGKCEFQISNFLRVLGTQILGNLRKV